MLKHLLITVSVLGAAGCNSSTSGEGFLGRSPESISVARNAVGQLVAYEQQVERKMKAEEEYYEDTQADLIESTTSSRADRIKAAVNTQASIAASEAIRGGSASAEDLRAFGSRVLQAVGQSRDEEERRLSSYRNDYLRSLESFELDKESLKAVRKGLESLQTPLTDAEQLKRLLDAYKTMKEAYDATVDAK